MKMKNTITNYVIALVVAFMPYNNAHAKSRNAKVGFDVQTGTLTLSERLMKPGELQSRISKYASGNFSKVKSLIIDAGEIDLNDCKFITTNLTNLEELYLEGTANFTNGTIPKSAFEKNMSLRKIKIDNVESIGLKAFSLCANLEDVSFTNVTKIGVQAFAQEKGFSLSKLKTVKLPKLREMEPRVFYYCTNLEVLYLTTPPQLVKPEGKEGLWFERVTKIAIHVPNKFVYDEFMKPENNQKIDWSAFNFIANNGDKLPVTAQAAEYNDANYNQLHNQLLSNFDRSNKDFSGGYYNGDYKLSLNLYTFNLNLNSWMNNSSSTPQLNTLDAIRWAKKAGFDAVDITFYYIPGYSNTTMPTTSEKEILNYAKQIKQLCAELKIEISGTGLQNNFADPSNTRREMDIERIKFWLKVADEMGAPVIRVFAGPPPADIRREGWEKIARDRMAVDIRKVAQYAKTHYPNVKIGVQNHGDMLATANQVIQLLKWIDCDNVGIVNDTGFYRDFLSTDATEYDWYRDIALLLPYSNNFQVKKKPAGAETSELMDLNRLFTDIRQSPYRGYIPIELLWINKDEGHPGSLKKPPYEETIAFLAKVKKAMEESKRKDKILTYNNQVKGGLELKASHPNIISVDQKAKMISVLENTGLYQLVEQIDLRAPTQLRALDKNNAPRTEIEELRDGDKLVVNNNGDKQIFTINIKRYELIDLALNPNPANIKVSSFRGTTSGLKAFDGNSTGTSVSGVQVDGSQANAKGEDTFWLAVDLGEEKEINSFGVAWGTSVANLRKRLKNGTYRIEYTNDPNKWKSLSNATSAGKSGYDNYKKPSGWTLVYEQNTNNLPDANGNKVFNSPEFALIRARYVMITGELATSFIEIYNLYVFQKKLTNGKSQQPVYSTEDLVRIKPDYDGMTLAIGRPAIIRQSTQVPAYYIMAMENVTIEGKLLSPQREVVFDAKKVNIKKDESYKLSIPVNATLNGTYKMVFTISGDKTVYDTYYFTAVKENISDYNYHNPYPAIYIENDKLVYVPDYKGNTVMDYSNVGYKGGGILIPNISVKIVLEPSTNPESDDTGYIQNAINMLGRVEPDSNGFRGAILLKAGTYRVSRPIQIDKSGIVIKGEGDGHEKIKKHLTPLSPTDWFDYTQSEEYEKGVTKIVATWIAPSYDKNVAIFNIAGSGDANNGKSVDIISQYIPAGSHSIRVASTDGFKVGKSIKITKAVNAAWIQDLKMDVITDAPGVLSANQWGIGGNTSATYRNFSQERTIKSINSATKTIVLTEPVVDPLDMKYGVSTITTFDPIGRLQCVGVENIQLISRFDSSTTAGNSAFDIDYKSYDDEYHAQVGIRFGNAENVWTRRITSYHIDGVVNVSGGVRWVTIQDVNCLEPVSGTGGERRYSYSNSGGTLVLNQRNYVRYTRHGFIVMGNVVGQNVFYNNRSDFQFDANEPHLRWSTGGLFDNVKGRIYVQNRWNNGTAHGWSGANYTLYNNEGPFIISQSSLASNYLFGQSNESDRVAFIMNEVDPGNVPNYMAYEYSTGKKMIPNSLYIQQLKDRMGKGAVECTNESAIPAYIDESASFIDQFAFLVSISVDGKKLSDFKNLPIITAIGEKGVKVERKATDKGVIFIATKDSKIQNSYMVSYDYVSKEKISSTGSSNQLESLLDGNHKTTWSQSGSPSVQFYLGDTPVTIEKISLGYGRNTQIRRQYYFDFEISNDGYTWEKVLNPIWQKDNLNRGHIMGMQVMPGVGNNKSDYETFDFPRNIKARLLRVSMFGARNGQGIGSTNSNQYWAIDIE